MTTTSKTFIECGTGRKYVLVVEADGTEQVQFLDELEHFQFSNRCDLCLMGERHTNIQHDQRIAAAAPRPIATEDGTRPASVSHGNIICRNRR